jgi:quinol monooxygenase YgiN
MIVVTARFKVRPDGVEEVEKQFRMLIEYVRNEEPGTLMYLFHRAQDDPTRFLFYERYQDNEALTKHGGSARFQQVFGKVAPLLEEAPVIELFDEIAGKR